jgi:hypothetical protein
MASQERVGDFVDEGAGERSDQRDVQRPPSQAHAGPRSESTPRAHARSPRAIRAYRRWRGSTGVLLVGLIFAGAWLLNGYFTARAVAALRGDWSLGWAIHLIITAVELTTALVGPSLRAIRAPLWVHCLLWAVVLPFGLVDTGTSALGLLGWGLALGLPLGLSLSIGVTVLAEIIAFVPEPMLVWLVLAFRQVLHE